MRTEPLFGTRIAFVEHVSFTLRQELAPHLQASDPPTRLAAVRIYCKTEPPIKRPGSGTSGDVRAREHDGLATPAEDWEWIRGNACAGCGSSKNLQPGGFAYVKLRGLLGYAVRVCPNCPQSVGGAR